MEISADKCAHVAREGLCILQHYGCDTCVEWCHETLASLPVCSMIQHILWCVIRSELPGGSTRVVGTSRKCSASAQRHKPEFSHKSSVRSLNLTFSLQWNLCRWGWVSCVECGCKMIQTVSHVANKCLNTVLPDFSKMQLTGWNKWQRNKSLMKSETAVYCWYFGTRWVYVF